MRQNEKGERWSPSYLVGYILCLFPAYRPSLAQNVANFVFDMADSVWWEGSYKRVSQVTAERPLYVHDSGITAGSQIWDNYAGRQLEL